MEQLAVFEKYNLGKIRGIFDKEDGEAWFIGKDVAKALGYKDTDDAIRKHVDPEDKLPRRFAGVDQEREAIFINESGVYSLIFSSKLPSARAFKRWVTSEVLPSIRKKGYYVDETAIRLEQTELLLSGYKELQPNKARFLHEDLIKTLKDQNRVLRAENSSLRRSLKISADRTDDLEAKLTDVKENLINQLLGIEIEEK